MNLNHVDINRLEQMIKALHELVEVYERNARLAWTLDDLQKKEYLWKEIGFWSNPKNVQGVSEVECLEGCELQQFVDKRFYCTYYESDLVSEIGVVNDAHSVLVYRCQQCIDEGIKGINKVTNNLEGIRKALVYLGDHFYSFKDEFENGLADLYRYLKRLEKGE